MLHLGHRRRWLRTVAAVLLFTFGLQVLPPGPWTAAGLAAAAGPDEEPPAQERRDPWPADLPDVLILRPFPADVNLAPAASGGADPVAFNPDRGSTRLWFASPAPGGGSFQEAQVDLTVTPAEPPGPPRTIHSGTYSAGTDPISYPWDGDGLPDGIYTWSYRYTPLPPPCTGASCGDNCPPEGCPPPAVPPPAAGGPYPVILDREAPAIIGLRLFRDGWLGVEVADRVSGVAAVDFQVLPAGGGDAAGGSAIPLSDHPRHAVVRLPVEDLADPDQDLAVRLTVTDLAGNVAQETLPLHPVLRTAQLGSAGAWPAAASDLGGEPQAVNLVTGNGHFVQWEITLPAFTLDLTLSRSYNHQHRVRGLLGWGWRLSLEQDLHLWPAGDRLMATWQDESGTEYTFVLGDGEGTPYVDGVPRAWPRLSRTGTGDSAEYVLRWPDGASILFDAEGRARAVRDHLGNARITYQWQDGRLTAVQAGAFTVTLAYGENGLVRRLTIGPSQHAIEFTYDGRGNLTGVQGLAGRRVEFGYDDLHRLTSVTHHLARLDAAGNVQDVPGVILWSYGPGNRVSGIAHQRDDGDATADPPVPARAFRTFHYAGDGHRATVRDGDERVTEYEWDGAGRLRSITRYLAVPGGGALPAAETFWHQGDLLIRYTDPLGRITRYRYDGHDNLTELVLPDGVTRAVTEYTYDAGGRVTAARTTEYGRVNGAEAALRVTTAEFSDGRLRRQVVEAGGQREETRYTYWETGSAAGLLRSVTDPRGFVTLYEYDPVLGRVSRVIDWPEGGEDPADPRARWTAYGYDELGQVSRVTVRLGPDGDQVTTEYRRDWQTGHLTVTERQPAAAQAAGARDVVTEVLMAASYLPGTRPLRVVRSYAGESGSPVTAATYTYNNAGMLLEAVLGEERSVTRYNAYGEPVVQVENGLITRHERDTLGRVVRTVTPLGGEVRYTYDAAGRLTGEVRAYTPAGGTQERVLESITYAYDPLGRLAEVRSSVGGLRRYTYEFHPDGPRVRMTHWAADGRILSEAEERQDWFGRLTLRRVKDSVVTYRWSLSPYQVEIETGRGAPGAVQPDQVETLRLDGRSRVTAASLGRTGAEDPEKTTFYTYDGLDRLVAKDAPAGGEPGRRHTYRAVYDAQGNLVRTEADGEVTTYSHDLLGNLADLTAMLSLNGQPVPGTVSLHWNGGYRLQGFTFAGGGTQVHYSLTWDSHGFPRALTGAGGTLYRWSVDPAARRVTATRGHEGTAAADLDPFGHPVRLRTPDGETLEITLTTPDPQAGGSTAFLYGTPMQAAGKAAGMAFQGVAGGYLLTVRHPDGTYTQEVFDENGNVTAVADNLGRITRYEYDALGRVTAVVDPLGQRETFTYDALGRLLTATNARGATTRYRYEDNGLTVVREDALGHRTVTRLSVAGLPLAVTDANGHTTRYEYDARGNLTRVISPTGAVTTYEYDGFGNLVRVVDPLGRATVYTRDALGRVTAVTDPEGNTETYTYNDWGRVTRHVSRETGTTTYGYNAAGRLTEIREPGGRVTTYGRDAAGRVVSVRDPAGNVTTYRSSGAGWWR